MSTRPGPAQCLVDCPEDGEPLASRREGERKESDLNMMDSLNLGELVPRIIKCIGLVRTTSPST